jgi:hypothetical protein
VTVFVKRYRRNPTFQICGLGGVSLRPQELSIGYRVKKWGHCSLKTRQRARINRNTGIS